MNPEYDLGDLMDTQAAVAVTIFRPSDDQAVPVVAAADPDAVDARLRPQLGENLCVVASTWTQAQLDSVRGYLDVRFDEWNLYQLGPLNGEDGQICMEEKLTRVLPEIATRAAGVPAGILSLQPRLRRSPRAPGAAPWGWSPAPLMSVGGRGESAGTFYRPKNVPWASRSGGRRPTRRCADLD